MSVLKKSKRLAFSIAQIAIKIFVLILLKPLHSMANTCLPLHTFEKLYCSSQSGWLCLVIFSLDFATFYQSFSVQDFEECHEMKDMTGPLQSGELLSHYAALTPCPKRSNDFLTNLTQNEYKNTQQTIFWLQESESNVKFKKFSK